MQIRPYQKEDEQGWLRCRVVSFLNTAYYDNVLREKETYANDSIELVAVENNHLIGLIDVEIESEQRTICTRDHGLGGMIWHLAVHPDHQRKGIARKLLQKAEDRAKEKGLRYVEAWTRDDAPVLNWYQTNGFTHFHSYLHVYVDRKEEVSSPIDGLHVLQAFGHYYGDEGVKIKALFERVHECNGLEKLL
ncbi:GNAT family N-acetyltransferase [Aureibacillus halotolerans]|uniref:Ribosomal protein S18 acetylase RimI-like enzyme n=1 Tax=Aureibacillus halotolerans TaxID=1508390 RepID=A0A4R6TX61_9BACI|nr:GNAT family N-acetyltransferase [Aureibacillus halotolerans]TDQ36599.1 ribosomal protein S18 acetylase RimI-like enzyme [Aureibacillus halotolerans]